MQITKDFVILKMMKKILIFLMVLICPIFAGAVESVDIFSDEDAATYAQIFMLQDKEKIDAAKKLEAKLTDKYLMNEVLYQRYVSKTYRTHGTELQNWMKKYYDMPGAERLAKIAKIKKASTRKPDTPHIVTGKEYMKRRNLKHGL